MLPNCTMLYIIWSNLNKKVISDEGICWPLNICLPRCSEHFVIISPPGSFAYCSSVAVRRRTGNQPGWCLTVHRQSRHLNTHEATRSRLIPVEWSGTHWRTEPTQQQGTSPPPVGDVGRSSGANIQTFMGKKHLFFSPTKRDFFFLAPPSSSSTVCWPKCNAVPPATRVGQPWAANLRHTVT